MWGGRGIFWAEAASLELQFERLPENAAEANRQDRQDWQGTAYRQVLLMGCRATGKGGPLFNKSAHKPLPVLRFCSFLNGLVHSIEEKTAQLDCDILQALSKLKCEDRTHNNALDFSRRQARDWRWQLLELHLWDARGDAGREAFKEKKHDKEGASCINLSYTVAGPRTLQCDTEGEESIHASSLNCVALPEGGKQLTVRSEAGTLYCGGMGACRHQVFHRQRSASESISIGNTPCFAAIQCRCNIFNRDKARGNAHKPTSKPVFQAVMRSIRNWQLRNDLSMPSLALCEAELKKLEETQQATAVGHPTQKQEPAQRHRSTGKSIPGKAYIEHRRGGEGVFLGLSWNVPG